MMKRILLSALLVPAFALAQPKSADDWYKEGETEYNLGNFEKAAEAFKQGFATEQNDSKKPAYLYNVAQSYRQGNKCKDAAFFYKRYLSLKDQDTAKPLKPEKRAEIEKLIGELEECSRTQDSIASKPPEGTTRPDGATKTGPKTGGGTPTGPTGPSGPSGPTGSTGPTGGDTPTGGTTPPGGKTVAQAGGEGGEGGEDGDSGGSVTGSGMASPTVINARFVGGAEKLSLGSVNTNINSVFTLTAGYPVVTQMQGGLVVDAGLTFAFTPVPFKNNVTGMNQTASLTSVLANGAVTYAVIPKLFVRGDVGVGALVFGGISDMGSPFTEGGAGTSGSLAMFAVRGGLSVDYAITPNLAATVTPIAVTYSPAKDGLVFSSIMRLDFMLGIGYRM